MTTLSKKRVMKGHQWFPNAIVNPCRISSHIRINAYVLPFYVKFYSFLENNKFQAQKSCSITMCYVSVCAGVCVCVCICACVRVCICVCKLFTYYNTCMLKFLVMTVSNSELPLFDSE